SVLGDNGTGYQKTGHLGVPNLFLGTTGHATRKRDIWVSRICAWGQRDMLPKNGPVPFKTGRMITLVIQ
ncbi:hypothetical protein AVEN_272139-1, partial [Araneus ventricosus]